MSNFTKNISALERITADFCTNPITVHTEKHFLIRKLLLGLGTQIQKNIRTGRKRLSALARSVLGQLKKERL